MSKTEQNGNKAAALKADARAETTYLPEILCTATPSRVFDKMANVTIADRDGNKESLQVRDALISKEGDRSFLSVGIVRLDRGTKSALVELPLEADSGTNRLWVPFSSFRREGERA